MKQLTKGLFNKLKAFMKQGGFFLLLMAITFFVVFRKLKLVQLLNAFFEAKPAFLLVGMFAMLIFITCEAINIRRILRLLGNDISHKDGFKYAFIGFFFSAVTPSASGGQPMQVYYMNKDAVPVTRSALALLIELCSFQIISVLLGFGGLIYKFDYMSRSLGNLKIVFIIGVGINLAVLFILLMAVFSKKIINFLVALIVNVMTKLKIRNADKKEEALYEQIANYHKGAEVIKANKKFMVRTLMVTLVQLVAMHSVPFWVYLSLGGEALGMGNHSLIGVVALQAVLFVSVSALPLPGAVGISESAFVILFKMLFPSGLLAGAMLLSRGISFYIMVAIAGLAIIILKFCMKKSLN